MVRTLNAVSLYRIADGNKTNLKYGKTQNTGEDCHDGSCQGGVGNFPEKILPDGESGIFSAAVHCKNTAGLENTADTAKSNTCSD